MAGVISGAGTTYRSMRSNPDFSEVRVAQSLVFCKLFCRSLFVYLFWPLFCLYFHLRLLVTPLVSSNFHYNIDLIAASLSGGLVTSVFSF